MADEAHHAKRRIDHADSAKTKRMQTTPKQPQRSKTAKKKKKKFHLLGLLITVTAVIVLALALIASTIGLIFYEKAELPDPNAEFSTQTSRIFFNDGTTEMASLSVQNRTNVSYSSMPRSIKDAVVAAEDRSFWDNKGIDFKGMSRALVSLFRTGKIAGGGSTITQQYIKIRYLTSDQTFSRKVNELALAIKINKKEPKERVLEGYLNTIYFGRGAYGIQAAAKTYFGVNASDLTVGQSAMLAALINAPSMLDPANGPEAAQQLLERYNYVLDGMLNPLGTITQKEHDQFYGTLPDLAEVKTNDIYGGPNGFLINMAINELETKGFSADEISGGGLKIITTIDPKMQQAAVDAAQSTAQKAAERAVAHRDESGNLVKPDAKDLHVGLASLEVGTGSILALYGGSDFVSNSVNWATTPRYAGSTFKVWGAVAGLRNGFGLKSRLRGSTYTPPGDGVPVHNDSGANYGHVSLQTAIRDSINTSFVDMIGQIPNGTEELVRAATDAGLPEQPSWAPQAGRMVLGEGEVSVLDNTTGYATLANNGRRNETHIVSQVLDPTGATVYKANTEATQTIEDPIARDITTALSTAAAGSSVRAVGGRAVAGKTGTEGIAAGQDGAAKQITRAAWLAGYTKQIATSVLMVAGEDGNGNLDVYNAPGQRAFYGAGYPTEAWNAYMSVATAHTPITRFDPPGNVRPKGSNTAPRRTRPQEQPRQTHYNEESEEEGSQTTEPADDESASTDQVVPPKPRETSR